MEQPVQSLTMLASTFPVSITADGLIAASERFHGHGVRGGCLRTFAAVVENALSQPPSTLSE